MTSYPSRLQFLILPALGVAVASVGVATGAEEAQATPTQDDEMIEELVVTATYRDTELMDTPLTISALTDLDLEQRGVEDIKSLFLAVPGLNYGNATNTWHRVVARGVPQFNSPTGPVALYVDNVPVSGQGNRQPLLPNFDLERIEVLKGPQGSLYGEGSMAGAVRYITKKPNPEGFDYALTSRVEDQSQSSDLGHRIDAMVNLPLGERLAARVTGFSRHKPGLIDKLGPVRTKDVDFVEEIGYRAQLAWYATDTITLNATIYDVESDIGGPGIAFHCYVDPRPPGGNLTPGDFEPAVPNYPVIGGCERGPNGTFDGETALFKAGPGRVYVTHMASPEFEDGGNSESTIYNLNFDWQLPWADLTASAAVYDHAIYFSEEQRVGGRFGTSNPDYTDQRQVWHERVDAACAVIGCDPGAFWARSSVRAHSDINERKAYEVRLVSNQPENRWQWSIGVFHQELENGPDASVWGPCGASHSEARVAYGGPQYTDVVCQGGGFTFDPAKATLAEQREIHKRLLGTRGFSAGWNLREETAFFGEVSYRLTEQFDVLVGLRTSDNEFERRQGASGMWVPASAAPVIGQPSQQNKAAPKFTVTWRPMDDWMVFATYAEAFRSGGVNTRLANQTKLYEEAAARGIPGAAENFAAALDLLTFEGDDVESIELGLKTTVLDGRLDIMLSAYDTQIDNAVVTTSASFSALADPANPSLFQPYDVNVSDNVGRAESRGIEYEFRGQLTDQIRFHAGGAWVPDAETLTQSAGGNIGGVARSVNIEAGNRIRFTPVHSYFASLMYDFAFAGFNSTARGDLYYRGEKVYRTENNERPTPTYAFLNLKLLMSRDKYELGLYVKNVTDAIAPYSLGDSGYHGFHPPRSFGAQFSYNL